MLTGKLFCARSCIKKDSQQCPALVLPLCWPPVLLPSLQGTLCQQECEASCEIQLILQPAHTPPSRAGPAGTRQHYQLKKGRFSDAPPLPFSQLFLRSSPTLPILSLIEGKADLWGCVSILKYCCRPKFDLESLKA